MVFDDLESLWKYAKKEIKNAVKNEVVDEIKNVEQETIQEVVLDAYTPTYYDRRSEVSSGEEGLISKKNMVADYTEGDNFIEVNITNDTRGNSNYVGSTSGYIDEIIEFGEGYTWQGSQLAIKKMPRPFTEVTQKKIDDGEIVARTIKNAIDFEIK